MLKEKLLNQNAQGALRDILVLDFTRWISGPYCSNMLSDMGATVIKIESLRGDQGRDKVGGNMVPFHTWNHGKKSLAMDLGTEKGREIIYRLVEEADIFLENLRPGMADQLGVGYEKLFGINPGIVYCSINGFGNSPSAYADKGALDPVMQGYGGVMSVTGFPDGPPVRVGTPIADQNGACYGYAALMTALYYRVKKGIGQHVSVALIDTMVFSLSTRFSEFVAGIIPQRMGNAHAYQVAFGAFPTADGWINVATVSQEHWRLLCSTLRADYLMTDPRYASHELRRSNRNTLTMELEKIFRAKTSKDWLEILTSAGVVCGPIWNIKELIESDLVKDHGFVVDVYHPVEGRYPVLQAPFKFSVTPGKVQGPAPLLGEHTREILISIGYRDNEIQNMIENHVIEISKI